MEFDDGDPEPEVEGIPLADEEAAKPAKPKPAAKAAAATATRDTGQAPTPPRIRAKPRRTTRSPNSSSTSSSTTRNDRLADALAHPLRRTLARCSHGRIIRMGLRSAMPTLVDASLMILSAIALKNKCWQGSAENAHFVETRRLICQVQRLFNSYFAIFATFLLIFGNFAHTRIDFWAKTL